jgi:hypothetical protein
LRAYISFGIVQRLLREEPFFSEIARAVCQLTSVLKGRHRGLILRVELGGVDLGDELTCFYTIARIHGNAGEISTDLRIQGRSLIRERLTDQRDRTHIGAASRNRGGNSRSPLDLGGACFTFFREACLLGRPEKIDRAGRNRHHDESNHIEHCKRIATPHRHLQLLSQAHRALRLRSAHRVHA